MSALPGARTTPPAADSPISVIEPAGKWSFPDLRELWHYRDLLYVLTRRDIAVRYKQTAVGIAWAVLQPVGLAVVFAVFLGIVFDRSPSGGIPYAVFLLCGFTIWVCISQAVGRGAQSTVSSAELIEKVYFPRVIIPIAAIVPPIVDFGIGFVVLLATMLAYGLVPPIQIALAPLVFLIAMALVLGASLLLSGLAVKYRDVLIGVPFVLQVAVYASAVIYPLSLAPESARPFLGANPLVGLMETFRWTVIPGADSPGLLLLVPAAASIVAMIAGLLYFHRTERSFADII